MFIKRSLENNLNDFVYIYNNDDQSQRENMTLILFFLYLSLCELILCVPMNLLSKGNHLRSLSV